MATEVRSSVDQWSEAWPALVHLPAGTREGGPLALRHPLRALDAIHVAAALALRPALPDGTLAFASFDARQDSAARAEGWPCWTRPPPR
jgi:predicted nucleic acid-binding protein